MIAFTENQKYNIILASEWNLQARDMIAVGVPVSQIVALFWTHVKDFATSGGTVSGFAEGDVTRILGPEQPVIILPAEDDESEDLYAPAGLAVSGAGVREGMSIVQFLISQAPVIVIILKYLGYAVVAEELIEFITGSQGLSTVDDVVQAWINEKTGWAPGLPGGDVGVAMGKGDDPVEYQVGQVREGWEIQKKKKYDYGKEYQENCWYKPYKDPQKSKVGSTMNFRERCGYYQGIRVQTVTGREAKYRAFHRGFEEGATQQQEAERASEGGTTPLVSYQRSRGRR